MAISKGKTFTDNEQVTAAKLHQLVDDATIDTDAVGASQLADGTVTNAKVATAAGLALSKIAVTSGTLVGGSATSAAEEVTVGAGLDLTSSALTIPTDGVTTAMITDANVTAAKLEAALSLTGHSVTLAAGEISYAELDTDFIADVSDATPTAADYLIFQDVDDSNLTKRALVDDVVGLASASAAFVSGGISVTGSGTVYSGAHGLGHDPYHIQSYFVCTTTDGGYAVGDVIDASAVGFDDGSYQPGFLTVGYDNSNQIFAVVGSSTPRFVHKSTGAKADFTKSSWTLTINAW